MFGGSRVVIPWAFFIVFGVNFVVHGMDSTVEPSSSGVSLVVVSKERYVVDFTACRGSRWSSWAIVRLLKKHGWYDGLLLELKREESS